MYFAEVNTQKNVFLSFKSKIKELFRMKLQSANLETARFKILCGFEKTRKCNSSLKHSKHLLSIVT